MLPPRASFNASWFKIESVDWPLEVISSGLRRGIRASIVGIPLVVGQGRGCEKIHVIVGSKCFLGRDWIATEEGREEVELVIVKIFKTEKVLLSLIWAFSRRRFVREWCNKSTEEPLNRRQDSRH
jgi:hypothetical protein